MRTLIWVALLGLVLGVVIHAQAEPEYQRPILKEEFHDSFYDDEKKEAKVVMVEAPKPQPQAAPKPQPQAAPKPQPQPAKQEPRLNYGNALGANADSRFADLLVSVQDLPAAHAEEQNESEEADADSEADTEADSESEEESDEETEKHEYSDLELLRFVGEASMQALEDDAEKELTDLDEDEEEESSEEEEEEADLHAPRPIEHGRVNHDIRHRNHPRRPHRSFHDDMRFAAMAKQRVARADEEEERELARADPLGPQHLRFRAARSFNSAKQGGSDQEEGSIAYAKRQRRDRLRRTLRRGDMLLRYAPELGAKGISPKKLNPTRPPTFSQAMNGPQGAIPYYTPPPLVGGAAQGMDKNTAGSVGPASSLSLLETQAQTAAHSTSTSAAAATSTSTSTSSQPLFSLLPDGSIAQNTWLPNTGAPPLFKVKLGDMSRYIHLNQKAPNAFPYPANFFPLPAPSGPLPPQFKPAKAPARHFAKFDSVNPFFKPSFTRFQPIWTGKFDAKGAPVYSTGVAPKIEAKTDIGKKAKNAQKMWLDPNLKVVVSQAQTASNNLKPINPFPLSSLRAGTLVNPPPSPADIVAAAKAHGGAGAPLGNFNGRRVWETLPKPATTDSLAWRSTIDPVHKNVFKHRSRGLPFDLAKHREFIPPNVKAINAAKQAKGGSGGEEEKKDFLFLELESQTEQQQQPISGFHPSFDKIVKSIPSTRYERISPLWQHPKRERLQPVPPPFFNGGGTTSSPSPYQTPIYQNPKLAFRKGGDPLKYYPNPVPVDKLYTRFPKPEEAPALAPPPAAGGESEEKKD